MFTYGALVRIRTGDPHLTMVVLYLLSYKGKYNDRRFLSNFLILNG